jgi:predicted phage terminase large subunit-like protein
MRVYGGSDYAVTKAGGDYTVHAVIGLDPEDRPWLLELWRERASSDVWIDAWCKIVKFYKPMSWAEEHGQILAGVGPFLERESHKQKAFTERIQIASRFDKAIRAQSMRSHVATHGLWYPSDLIERSALESELLSFPAGKHDDIHDAIGLVGQLLDMAVSGNIPKTKTNGRSKDYRHTGAAIERDERWKLL